jgi:hypothetical protein
MNSEIETVIAIVKRFYLPVVIGLLSISLMLSSCSFGELPDVPSASDSVTSPRNSPNQQNDRVRPFSGHEGITDPHSVASPDSDI